MTSPDTGAGTPLTVEERDALETVLAVVRNAARSEFAPYMGDDHADAFLAALAAVDPPLTVRPATGPAGLDEAIDYAAHMTHHRYWDSDHQGGHNVINWRECREWPCTVLSVADGPGPEERPSARLSERLPGAADRPANEAAVVAAVGDHEVRDDPAKSTTTPA